MITSLVLVISSCNRSMNNVGDPHTNSTHNYFLTSRFCYTSTILFFSEAETSYLQSDQTTTQTNKGVKRRLQLYSSI